MRSAGPRPPFATSFAAAAVTPAVTPAPGALPVLSVRIRQPVQFRERRVCRRNQHLLRHRFGRGLLWRLRDWLRLWNAEVFMKLTWVVPNPGRV